MVEEKIAGPLQALTEAGLEIGYCAQIGTVDVRLVAQGATAAHIVAEAARIVRELLKETVFGTDDKSLEEVIVRLLTERNLRAEVTEPLPA